MVIAYELTLEGSDGELVKVQVSHNDKNEEARTIAADAWHKVRGALTHGDRLVVKVS